MDNFARGDLMYRAAVLLFVLTLSFAQDKPKEQDCYDPSEILTMNFGGKDSMLVITHAKRSDAPQITAAVKELMKKYDRDLPKVKAALKPQFPNIKTDIIEGSAYNDWKEELMRNAKPCKPLKQG
jgi:hypothetical protein